MSTTSCMVKPVNRVKSVQMALLSKPLNHHSNSGSPALFLFFFKVARLLCLLRGMCDWSGPHVSDHTSHWSVVSGRVTGDHSFVGIDSCTQIKLNISGKDYTNL